MKLIQLLFLMDSFVRLLYLRDAKKSTHPVKVIFFLLYILISFLPSLALYVKGIYLPVFYLLYFLMSVVQKRLVPLPEGKPISSCRVRFTMFASIHLSVLGGAALLTDTGMHVLLVDQVGINSCLTVAMLLYVLLEIFVVSTDQDVLFFTRPGKKKEFKHLYHFVNCNIVYIFFQSLLLMRADDINFGIRVLLLGNVIYLVIMLIYVKSLLKVFRVEHAEQSYAMLHKTLSQSDVRLRAMRDSVLYDQLTNAYSRVYLIQEATRLLDSQIPFALVYMDLNGLKKINDTFGHRSGDEYLVQFVYFLGNHIRGEDVLARFGGDEFVLLMPECSSDNAEKRINDIRKTMLGVSDQFAFSAGIADSTEGDQLEHLISLADQRMYQEKRKGRTHYV